MTATRAVISSHEQRSTHTVERCLLCGDIAVLVQLKRGRDLGMTQDELDVAWWYAEVLEQRGRGVTQVMDGDASQSGAFAEVVEVIDEVARPYRSAIRAEKDEI
nr:hypothetical protein [Mycobacterium sp. BK086]